MWIRLREDTSTLLELVLGAPAAGRITSLADLAALRGAGVSELMGTYDLVEADAAKVKALFELAHRISAEPLRRGSMFRSAKDAYEHARSIGMLDLEVEQFLAVLLDARNRVMEDIVISLGTLSSALVHPREVFCPAIRARAAALIILHNHPSGDSTPSTEDQALTRRLVASAELLGIPLLDHLVVARSGFVSLREKGWM